MQYQIIACDLGGTLLDETGRVSKENWGFVREWVFPRELGHSILDLLAQYETTSLIHIGPRTYVDETTRSPRDYAKFNMNTTKAMV